MNYVIGAIDREYPPDKFSVGGMSMSQYVFQNLLQDNTRFLVKRKDELFALVKPVQKDGRGASQDTPLTVADLKAIDDLISKGLQEAAKDDDEKQRMRSDRQELMARRNLYPEKTSISFWQRFLILIGKKLPPGPRDSDISRANRWKAIVNGNRLMRRAIAADIREADPYRLERAEKEYLDKADAFLGEVKYLNRGLNPRYISDVVTKLEELGLEAGNVRALWGFVELQDKILTTKSNIERLQEEWLPFRADERRSGDLERALNQQGVEKLDAALQRFADLSERLSQMANEGELDDRAANEAFSKVLADCANDITVAAHRLGQWEAVNPNPELKNIAWVLELHAAAAHDLATKLAPSGEPFFRFDARDCVRTRILIDPEVQNGPLSDEIATPRTLYKIQPTLPPRTKKVQSYAARLQVPIDAETLEQRARLREIERKDLSTLSNRLEMYHKALEEVRNAQAAFQRDRNENTLEAFALRLETASAMNDHLLRHYENVVAKPRRNAPVWKGHRNRTEPPSNANKQMAEHEMQLLNLQREWLLTLRIAATGYREQRLERAEHHEMVAPDTTDPRRGEASNSPSHANSRRNSDEDVVLPEFGDTNLDLETARRRGEASKPASQANSRRSSAGNAVLPETRDMALDIETAERQGEASKPPSQENSRSSAEAEVILPETQR